MDGSFEEKNERHKRVEGVKCHEFGRAANYDSYGKKRQY
jgi:hypothetical protein